MARNPKRAITVAQGWRVFQRGAAAFLAISDRFFADTLAARVFPPFDAPSADSAWACGTLALCRLQSFADCFLDSRGGRCPESC